MKLPTIQRNEKQTKSRGRQSEEGTSPRSRKVGSLKRRAQSHGARGEIKDGTQAHLQLKKLKGRGVGPLSEVEAWHAPAVRSTSAIENVKNITTFGHSDVEMARCALKRICKSRC